ncbi:FAD-dependent oxidoreductase [Cetobacterium sp.]|uniref:FAD-dependent oxidoreductase n=1 Tax=Cetobacterium sp. TaxID=2071632 RepID=UPI003F381987
MATRVSAYENEAKSVIILEKMPIIGGNTIRSGGAMNVVNPEKQKKQGIEDSIEKHTTQTWEGGNKVANKKLVETMTSNALDGVKWLENYGLKWKKEIGSVIGSVWPRTNQAEDILGTRYINTLEKAFSKYGGKIFLETKAIKLIEKDGKVIGVVATDKNGKDIEFIGKKGVIIATGGYAANFDIVKEYLDDGVYQKENLPKTLENTNHPGATGDGIKIAKDVNAQLVDMKHVQLLPMPTGRFGPTINVDNVIFINKYGNRYVKEDGRRDEICLATFAQKDGQYYMINDSQIIPSDRKTTSGQDLDELIKKGTVIEAQTLVQLAKEIGIPKDVLVKTINDFN